MYNKKGQGAIEYLLIIGGVLIVATIVVAIIISSGQKSGESTTESLSTYETLIDNTIVPPSFISLSKPDVNCEIVYNASPSGADSHYLIDTDEAMIEIEAGTAAACTCTTGEDVYVIAEKGGSYSVKSNPMKCP